MNTTELSPINAILQDASPRCQHRTLKGRCRQLATDSAATLCFHHARAQRQAKDDFSVLEPLIRKAEDLQSVEGISEDLAELHNLLAQGRVSPRRASVIAYIDSLLLRSFSEIEQQNKSQLNWYGQPIETCDYASLRERQNDSTAAPLLEPSTEPALVSPSSTSPLPHRNRADV